jgi:hypothetical protein
MDTDPPGGTAPPPSRPATPGPATTGSGSSGRERTVPIPQLVTELRDLVVAYVKQETIAPLQSLGRWIGFGVAGSLLLGFGVVFLAMSGLRALQDETGETFTGNWSWVPYVIVVVALAVGGALVWALRSRKTAKAAA